MNPFLTYVSVHISHVCVCSFVGIKHHHVFVVSSVILGFSRDIICLAMTLSKNCFISSMQTSESTAIIHNFGETLKNNNGIRQSLMLLQLKFGN